MDKEMENFIGYRKARTEKPRISFLPKWANNVEMAVLFVNLLIVIIGVFMVLIAEDVSSSGDNDGSFILSFFGKGC
tara:strand:+ start:146 stop:373 length:228 start_codon:yes stop_codon:yes gene_type:complete